MLLDRLSTPLESQRLEEQLKIKRQGLDRAARRVEAEVPGSAPVLERAPRMLKSQKLALKISSLGRHHMLRQAAALISQQPLQIFRPQDKTQDRDVHCVGAKMSWALPEFSHLFGSPPDLVMQTL